MWFHWRRQHNNPPSREMHTYFKLFNISLRDDLFWGNFAKLFTCGEFNDMQYNAKSLKATWFLKRKHFRVKVGLSNNFKNIFDF
jgi:hypothetical protein